MKLETFACIWSTIIFISMSIIGIRTLIQDLKDRRNEKKKSKSKD